MSDSAGEVSFTVHYIEDEAKKWTSAVWEALKMQAHRNAEIVTGSQLGPYPMEKLKRVERPTVRVTDNIRRVDPREHGFARLARGEFGPVPRRTYPLVTAMSEMTDRVSVRVDGDIATDKAPISGDPESLSRHIKSLGYFLRADVVGICELPRYAIYSHDMDGKPIKLDHQFAVIIVVDQDYVTMSGSTAAVIPTGSTATRSGLARESSRLPTRTTQ